jgi:hypothetical protein
MSQHGLKLTRPQQPRHGQEQPAVRDVRARTDAAAGTECEMVALRDVGLRGGCGGAERVVHVAERVEGARVADPTVVEGPDLVWLA